jgi:beta-glucosidase
VSIALNLYDVVAASTSTIDLEARRRLDGLQNRWFLDPIFRGSYPEDVVADLRGISSMDHVQDGDLAIIAAPLDTLCINYYSSFCPRGHEVPLPRAHGARPTPWVGPEDIELVDRGLPRSAMGWDIDPVGLTRVLTRVSDAYTTIPLMITENGLGDPDPVVEGVVEEGARWEYIRDHVAAVRDAMIQRVDVRVYFPWSLIDNFEWAWGYSQKFGLVHVDLETQQRTWKRSGHEYHAFLGS